MQRRNFLKSGLVSGAGAFAASMVTPVAALSAKNAHSPQPFTMKFSPEFGIFAEVAGKKPADQIRWGHDQGFKAWENTGLKNRSVDEQNEISNTIAKLGMEFGQFVGTLTFEHVTF